jgi:hypothetical protein
MLGSEIAVTNRRRLRRHLMRKSLPVMNPPSGPMRSAPTFHRGRPLFSLSASTCCSATSAALTSSGVPARPAADSSIVRKVEEMPTDACQFFYECACTARMLLFTNASWPSRSSGGTHCRLPAATSILASPIIRSQRTMREASQLGQIGYYLNGLAATFSNGATARRRRFTRRCVCDAYHHRSDEAIAEG